MQFFWEKNLSFIQHLLDTFIKQLLFNTTGISLSSFKLFPVVEVNIMN